MGLRSGLHAVTRPAERLEVGTVKAGTTTVQGHDVIHEVAVVSAPGAVRVGVAVGLGELGPAAVVATLGCAGPAVGWPVPVGGAPLAWGYPVRAAWYPTRPGGRLGHYPCPVCFGALATPTGYLSPR